MGSRITGVTLGERVVKDIWDDITRKKVILYVKLGVVAHDCKPST